MLKNLPQKHFLKEFFFYVKENEASFWNIPFVKMKIPK